MTDKPKKFKAVRYEYWKIVDTYWEEFEMTQDKWTELYEFADENGSSHLIANLPKKMTTNKDDWKLLWSCLNANDFDNEEAKTDSQHLNDEDKTLIEEIKQ